MLLLIWNYPKKNPGCYGKVLKKIPAANLLDWQKKLKKFLSLPECQATRIRGSTPGYRCGTSCEKYCPRNHPGLRQKFHRQNMPVVLQNGKRIHGKRNA